MNKKTSKELISMAVYQLMYKIPFSKINVKMVCDKAGVSRMTFYRYYNTLEDIFIDFSDERFADFYELHMENREITVGYFAKNIISYLKRYERQIKMLEKSGLMYILVAPFERYASYLINHTKQIEKIRNDNPLSVAYVAGGMFNVIFYWSKHDFKIKEEEMSKMFEELISKQF